MKKARPVYITVPCFNPHYPPLTYLQKTGAVEQEESLEDLIEMVEPFPVLQVLTDMEEIQQLRDVALIFDAVRQVSPSVWKGRNAGDDVHDVLQLAQFAAG